MPNCKQCGAPLTKGNIKVVRPRGKKRPYRIHRACPQVPSEAIQPPRRTGKLIPSYGLPTRDTAGNGLQRPQDSTAAPPVAEGVLEYSGPTRYRYFMTQEQADRVKLAAERTWGASLGIGFEVIPVPEDQVERAPEDYADLVEVTVKWKDE